jgi:hypothetical protein
MCVDCKTTFKNGIKLYKLVLKILSGMFLLRRLIESSGDFYVFDGIDQVIASKSLFKKVWI